MPCKAAIIIPTYNNKEVLSFCLDSLRNQDFRDFKILIVDDGSSDKTADFLRIYYPEAEIIALEKNRGYTRAAIAGADFAIENCQPDFLVFLNNDTRAEKGWLGNLIGALRADPAAGAAASNIFFMDNPEIINSQGGEIGFFGVGRDINFGVLKNAGKEPEKIVPAPCFAGAAVKTSVFKKIGSLDDRFYSYCEDLDWGLRAKNAGFKTVFEKSAVLYHKGSATWKNYEYEKTYLVLKNSLCVIIKNCHGREMIKLFSILLYYLAFLGAHLLNRRLDNGRLVKIKEKYPIAERSRFAAIPVRSIFWNMVELKETIRRRQNNFLLADRL